MDNTRESLGKILYPVLLIVVFGLVLALTVQGPGAEQSDAPEVADATTRGVATEHVATEAVRDDAAADAAARQLTAMSSADDEVNTPEPIHTADGAPGHLGPNEQKSDQIAALNTAPDAGAVIRPSAEEGITIAAAAARSERVAQSAPVPANRPVPVATAEKQSVTLTPPGPTPLPVVLAKEGGPEHVAATADPTPNIGGPIAEDVMAGGANGDPVQVHEHTVQLGETLTDIAKAYNIDIDTILAANHIPDPNRIRSGDKLSVPNVKGIIHQVKRGESLWHIANNYDVSVDDIVVANEINNPNTLQVGQSLVIPGAQAIIGNSLREALVSANGSLLRNFSWPVTGRISSLFGMRTTGMHYGLDIAVVTGTPVRAATAGKVTYSADAGSYGLLVKIDHGNGIETRYAHNSRLVAKNGQRVTRGQIIAYSGNTGRSTGPHVHFEIRRNGGALDPLDFLR